MLDPEDYYFDEGGLMVFTAKYHLKRGYCCESGCRHCPFKDRGSQPRLRARSLIATKSAKQNDSGNSSED